MTPWTLARQALSIHGTLQGGILEWVAIPFSRGSSWPRDPTQVSCTAGRFFTIWASRKSQSYRVIQQFHSGVYIYIYKTFKTLIQKYIHTLMLLVALFTITKIQKQFKCSSTDGWIKKMWCVCTSVYMYIRIMQYSAEKRMKLCICSSIVDLEDIVLSEISKTERDKHCMLSHVESKKWQKTSEYNQKAESQKKKNKLVGTSGGGEEQNRDGGVRGTNCWVWNRLQGCIYWTIWEI